MEITYAPKHSLGTLESILNVTQVSLFSLSNFIFFETKGRFELNSFDKKEIFSFSVHLLKSPRRKCAQILLISF